MARWRKGLKYTEPTAFPVRFAPNGNAVRNSILFILISPGLNGGEMAARGGEKERERERERDRERERERDRERESERELLILVTYFLVMKIK